ncbi:putative ubiquitin-conjugating enzyme E2 [Cafeteria roenbergensis virus]|uniref:E2 ubiquitin-conjugating enzyme n=1 Tax=Cafeteria roenbergensis virus (strain BV-PW1) TaxID=693272 RepID=E3T4K2_CROVB|nr:putative ubiquitin-conjugating enzyme E2 [Cafeteria roenbergensis virus BV-PW1]ADO67115.1 putative ubiquitin-conjugating enzyme E2 [Cafeteria roenbergensis virus BV-PW1]
MSEIKPLTLKRIAGDLRKFKKANPEHFKIYYDKNKPLEINFILYGREDSPFRGGEYLGKISHSPDYPLKPPDYYMYTPNGRFHTNKKICLTNSGYHPSDWAPAAWNLVTLLEGLSSVWHSSVAEDKRGIGHLHSIPSEIEAMAQESIKFNNTNYKDLIDKIKSF